MKQTLCLLQTEIILLSLWSRGISEPLTFSVPINPDVEWPITNALSALMLAGGRTQTWTQSSTMTQHVSSCFFHLLAKNFRKEMHGNASILFFFFYLSEQKLSASNRIQQLFWCPPLSQDEMGNISGSKLKQLHLININSRINYKLNLENWCLIILL